jgi:hypothetical protein
VLIYTYPDETDSAATIRVPVLFMATEFHPDCGPVFIHVTPESELVQICPGNPVSSTVWVADKTTPSADTAADDHTPVIVPAGTPHAPPLFTLRNKLPYPPSCWIPWVAKTTTASDEHAMDVQFPYAVVGLQTPDEY